MFQSERYARKSELMPMERPGNIRVLMRTPHSITFSLDNAVFLKVFLRPEEGVNPDLELPVLLARRDFPGVPRVLAALSYRRPRALPMTLAVASSYVAGSVSGDVFVLEALERFFGDVLAQGLPPAPEIRTEAMDGYLLEYFRELGRRAARLHMALAAMSGADFAPEPMNKLYLRSIYQSMRSHLHRAAREVDAVRREVPSLKPLPKRLLLERFAALMSLGPSGMRIRIHGDFSLENVLRVGQELVIVDYDGDVRLPLGERRIKRSPLRDVASMLQSVAVTARRGYEQYLAHAATDAPLLSLWLDRWLAVACGAFLDAYMEEAGEAPFLPADASSRRVLLQVYVLEQGLRAIVRAIDAGRQGEVPLLRAALGSLKGMSA